MRGIGQTAAQLKAYRRRFEALAEQGRSGPPPSSDRLTPLDAFGSNPGALKAFAYVPERLAPRPGLVVVLHGCTQNAAGYDHGTGWSVLAERHGFAVLFPEQTNANNPNVCFNWFQPGDTARGRGEALSIRQMVEAMVVRHGVDRSRVFVTGLSAGGAMTAAMLAAYPDVFAAGAVIAGLPSGCARNVQEALDCMFQGRDASPREWGDRVRAASGHRGPWPRLSVWHGSADATVKPVNAREIVKQWTDLHGLPLEAAARDQIGRHSRERWTRGGETLVESYTLAGMAHGAPLATQGDDGLGHAGAFLLDVGLSSTAHIAAFFGLADGPRLDAGSEPERLRSENAVAPSVRESSTAPESPRPGRIDVGRVIGDALRSAGLLKD